MYRDDSLRGGTITRNGGENRSQNIINYGKQGKTSRNLNVPYSKLPEISSRNRLTRDIEVRTMERRDIQGVVDTLDSVYPELTQPGFEDDRWQPEHFQESLEKFPEGHIVIIQKGKVIGFSLSFIIDKERLKKDKTEEDTEGDGFLDTHDPEKGNVLYVSEVVIKPEYQRQGLGKNLVRAQKKLSQKLGLKGCVGTSLLPGFDKYPEDYSAKDYAALRRDDGRLENRNLRFYEACGFTWGPDDIKKDYVADPNSRGYAVSMWMPNEK